MKAFVEYLHHGVITGKLIPVCGDRGIVILDGRKSLHNLIADAKSANGWHRPHYPGFRIYRGNLHHAKCIYEFVES